MKTILTLIALVLFTACAPAPHTELEPLPVAGSCFYSETLREHLATAGFAPMFVSSEGARLRCAEPADPANAALCRTDLDPVECILPANGGTQEQVLFALDTLGVF